MNLPAFTAEFSLYRSRNSYRVATAPDVAIPAQSVMPALTYEDTVNCSRCEDKCNEQSADCVEVATATWAAGLVACAVFGPFSPACAIPVTAAYAFANGICAGKLTACRVVCNAPGESCCPVFCELGHCCSHGETCMPEGCCPSNQVVCGGECCGLGESCCGDTCCPPNYFCRDGGNGKFCSDVPGNFPNTPPPTPPPYSCPPGAAPCGFPDSSGVIRTCCPPGLQCCGFFNGQPDCARICIR